MIRNIVIAAAMTFTSALAVVSITPDQADPLDFWLAAVSFTTFFAAVGMIFAILNDIGR